MKNNKWQFKPLTAAFALAGLMVISIPQQALAGIDTGDDTLEISGFVENATYFRDEVGLSKFRNTLQLEGEKILGNIGAFSEVSINGTFRATYDGVYDLNSDEYGDGAGGSILLEQIGVGPGVLGPGAPAVPAAQVPWGAGFALQDSGGIGGAGNPNSGLIVLGEHLHDADGGVTFGVPVRPCDKDSRGCLSGYMDDTLNDLRYSDFNDRWDFIRELYVSAAIDMDSGTTFNLSVGKKQEVWGRTDLFRVLDVLNPVDYSRNNIYDELEDIRIPLWMATAEWQFGANNLLDDMNLQFVWIFDKFRPSKLGQAGTPNQILDAGSFFRGMNNCWENGCTVSNFAGGGVATDFGPGVLGLRNVELPEWSLANSQFGAKFEGVYSDIGFSLNAFYTRSQLPSLRGGIPSNNPFTGAGGPFPPEGAFGDEPQVYPYLISFDMHFPRVVLVGGSLDYFSEPINTAFRVEAAWTKGEEFANTLKPRLFSESEVARWVIGADHNLFIRSINKNKAFLISFQTFGQHILDHDREDGLFGPVGMPDWKDNYISTLLIKGWWMNDRLSPQVISAYDWSAKAYVVSPSVDWLISDNWRLQVAANIKLGTGAREFSDCRTCNPFSPFTAAGHVDGPDADPFPDAYDTGLGGFEPLGRFRSGPIGMAQKEDEIQVTLRYRF
ncbi:MAG: hypothetical protein QNK15_00105 [Cycloclasticus sp.]|nr:hypothetical protein [Cycloclasticus sp.]